MIETTTILATHWSVYLRVRGSEKYMNDTVTKFIPEKIDAIEEDTLKSGFTMASDHQTGSLLRTLVATKRHARILELGTGTGLSACWLLDGMDADSRLESVDDDAAVVAIARKHLGDDSRVSFVVEDGSVFLREKDGEVYDFIFADTWPGKFWDLDLALGVLKPGGLYVIDDLLPQANWPDDHPPKVARLIKDLESRRDLIITRMNWSTGIAVVTRK